MKLCDRCRVAGCLLNYGGKACKNARKQNCPDVVFTNADRVREMNDEELAKFMLSSNGAAYCNSAQVERESHGNSENKAGRRNKRSVWSVSTNGFRGAHFAVFPEKLIEPCILAGCPEGGVVLDQFAGSGTTGVVAKRMGRGFVGCEINPSYVAMAAGRIAEVK